MGQTALIEKPMFGGLAWMRHGNLLCCANTTGVLLRLGQGNDAWALALPGVTLMNMGSRPMKGWVQVSQEAFAEPTQARRLLDAALDFVATLPAK